MNKMKERGRRKAALADRKSAAAQARMKNIASLAADDRVPKKKRKGGGGAFSLQPVETLATSTAQRTCLGLTTRIGPYIARL